MPASTSRPGTLATSPSKAPAAATSSGMPSPADLLRGLQRYLALALSLGMIVGALAATGVWAFYHVHRYQTRALLEVRSSVPTVARYNDELVEDRSRYTDYQTTQLIWLKSRTVLGVALRQPQAAKLSMVLRQPDPVSWLAENLGVSFSGEVMSVSLEGDDPGQIITLVNAVTDAYLKEVVELERRGRIQRFDALDKLSDTYQEDLKKRREALQTVAKNAGSANQETLAFKQQLLEDQLHSGRRQLDEIRSQLRDNRIRLSLLQPNAPQGRSPNGQGASAGTATAAQALARKPAAPAAPAVAPPPAPDAAVIEAAIARHPEVVAATEAINDLKKTLRHHQSLSRSGSDPAIRQVQAELREGERSLVAAQRLARQELQEQFDDQVRRGGGTRTAASGAPGLPRPDKEDPALLSRTIDYLVMYESELKQEIDGLEKIAASLNNDTLDLEATRDQIATYEENARRIGQEAERLKVELEAPPRVRVIEKAQVAQPLSLKKKVFLAGAVGMGIFGLILASFAWWGASARRVDRADDVVQSLGMNVMGVLPALPNRATRNTASRRNPGGWEHLLLESVDATRTTLLHASRTEQLRILMVTSAVKGEGKTSLSSHLATSLARARQRTLLIDGDLRSPMIQSLFDVPQSPGLAELLREEVALADVLQATSAPSLSLITAGQADADAIASLAEGRLEPILKELRDQYDFIIIDSAPVLPVADSLQISQHVDAVVFSVLRDVSRLPKIQAAYERLAALGVRMLGAVVAGSTTERDSYYSYYNSLAKTSTSS